MGLYLRGRRERIVEHAKFPIAPIPLRSTIVIHLARASSDSPRASSAAAFGWEVSWEYGPNYRDIRNARNRWRAGTRRELRAPTDRVLPRSMYLPEGQRWVCSPWRPVSRD